MRCGSISWRRLSGCSRPSRPASSSGGRTRSPARSFTTPMPTDASSGAAMRIPIPQRSRLRRERGGNVASGNNHYDVIIIGQGAGGGTLAWSLAPTGKKILLLERGVFVPREKENWSTRAVNLEARYNTKEEWRTSGGETLHPHTNYFVGGNTKFYGAALFRLRREDFGEIRHHGGGSPPWPGSYAQMEPYYATAAALY